MPRWSPFEPYFWSLVSKGEGNNCWIWLGGTDGTGYGRVWRKTKRVPAHRVAYELTAGPIPPNLFACHKCDNKICVRPSHLFLGTQKDNMQDWTKKGKNILINNPHLIPRGNNHHMKTKVSRKKTSLLRKKELAEGRRIVIRDSLGRIMGTKMVK